MALPGLLEPAHESRIHDPEPERLDERLEVVGVWYFADRQALLDEVLDVWEQTTVDDVIARVEDRQADPRTLLRRFFEDVAPSTDLTGELAIRQWARRDEAVAKRLFHIGTRRMAWMRSQFARFCADDDEAAGRSMLAYALLIGSYFIVAEQDDHSRPDMMRLAIAHLLA